MGINNSLEVYTSLTIRLYHDITQCYPKSRESRLDLMKIKSRLDCEGISFLTKTLPKLGKAIDLALHSPDPLSVPGFVKIPGTVIPKLFGWLLQRIFTADGYVRSDVDITALKHVRQILYFSYKLDIPYDKKTEQSVLSSFISTQIAASKWKPSSEFDSVLKEARKFITRLFSGFHHLDIIPKHGPGSVATGERTYEKHCFKRIYAALDRVYPFTEYFTLGCSHIADDLDWIKGLEVRETGTAKVVLVPKDSRGPRLISCEPLEYQWIQQGIQKRLYAWIEKHRLTRGHVNFTDQSVNRRLSLAGSLTGKWVTLDMKDASDRVSLRLVEELFCGTGLLEALKASRSTSTLMPDGKTIELGSFAPMGSAVCFPIEALVFYSLAVALLVKHKQYSLRKAISRVYVYGDDIIMDIEDYDVCLQRFPEYGLMFNSSKCCTSGFFRESCGCDAYKGIDVTPIRLRNRWNHRGKLDATELASYVSLSNSLYAAGYRGVALGIENMVENRYGVLPYQTTEYVSRFVQPRPIPGSLISWYRPDVLESSRNRCNGVKSRFNDSIHQLQHYGWLVLPVLYKTRSGGWAEMLRSLNCGSRLTTDSIYALPRRSRLKRGWGTC